MLCLCWGVGGMRENSTSCCLTHSCDSDDDMMIVSDVFLIGYGAVAGFNVGDEKPSHY
jgi:hypothetical protein